MGSKIKELDRNWAAVQLSVRTRPKVYLQEWAAIGRQEERTLKGRKLKDL